MRLLRSLFKDKAGATAIEYGLLAALLSVAVIGGYSAVSSSVNNTFETISTTYDDAAD